MINRDSIIRSCVNRCLSAEFIITEKCQNACKYCYRVKKHQLSDKTMLEPEVFRIYIRQIKKLFGEDFFQNRHIELFGGDALLDYKHIYNIFRVITEEIKEDVNITVPTNGRLLLELPPVDIKELIDILYSNNKRVSFSLSIDGIDEIQRNLSTIGKMLDYQQSYNIDKVRSLIKYDERLIIGFHPMFDFNTVDLWAKQFETFHSKGFSCYLLEVRHPIPSPVIALKAVYQLALIRCYLEIFASRKNLGRDYLKRFNTIMPSIVPRGLGCSAHTSLCITIDGNIPFCHRLLDPPWIAGNILTERINISKFVRFKMEYDHRNHVKCVMCPIRDLCSGQCVGASYEYWGDPWTPIDSICYYMMLKTYVFSRLFKDWKIAVEQSCKGIASKEMERLESIVFTVFDKTEVNNLVEDITEKRAEYEKRL